MHVERPGVVEEEQDTGPARLGPSWLVVVAVGVVGGLLGFIVGATGDGTLGSSDSVSGATTAVTTRISVSPPSTATSVPLTTSEIAGADTGSLAETVEVDLLDGAAVLAGDVAVTPFPGASGGSLLWVLRAGGSIVQRDDVPLFPGDYPYPMLFTASRIAFADLTHVYLVDGDLREPPVAVSEGSFVVPGSEPGEIWLVGNGVEWVAPLNVATGIVGEETNVSDVFWWPLDGLWDGLLVTPIDDATYGPQAYWSPTDGLQPIVGVDAGQSGIHDAAGEVAMVVSPGVVYVLDIETGEYVTSVPVELGEGLVSEVCLSPGHDYVAIFGSTGEALVADTRTGEVLRHLSAVDGHNSVGWTSNEQLVYIVDDGDPRIQALDITTGTSWDIAALRSHGGWWLTASGTMC